MTNKLGKFKIFILFGILLALGLTIRGFYLIYVFGHPLHFEIAFAIFEFFLIMIIVYIIAISKWMAKKWND